MNFKNSFKIYLLSVGDNKPEVSMLLHNFF